MARKELGDIDSGRLSVVQIEKNFGEVTTPLNRQRALIEAERCYYCYDAPCIQACPTGIDIPSFIRSISTDNLNGAASEILSANIFGGMCARVCPTEILCEGECVRNSDEEKPVEIGALQRYATDWVYRDNAPLFQRAPTSGKRVAVVGAGPAGLSCAHALARDGHQVTVFEANEKPGGLNEYGIAAYKVVDFAQREIEWLLSIGGIEIRYAQVLGRDVQLADLQRDFDAVFLAMGLAGVNAVVLASRDISGIEETSQLIEEIIGIGAEHVGEALPPESDTVQTVQNAVDFIAGLRQTHNKHELPVGRRVVVIGGGNTAIDAAVQSKRLGAESVTMVYRRGAESMSATSAEQSFAKEEGVNIIYWAQPHALLTSEGLLSAIEFEYTTLDASGKLIGTDEFITLNADTVLKAVGQVFAPAPLGGMLQIHKGRIAVDEQFRSSVPGIWAGGDCVGGKLDLTVQAVEDGKRAAQSIHAALSTAARASS